MGYEDCKRADAAEMTLDETREVMSERIANGGLKLEAMNKITRLFRNHWLVEADYSRSTEVGSVDDGGFFDIKPSKRITVTLVLEEEG